MNDLSGLSRSELRGTRLARGSVSRARGAGSSYISTTSTSGSSPSVAEQRTLGASSVRIAAWGHPVARDNMSPQDGDARLVTAGRLAPYAVPNADNGPRVQEERSC